MNATPRNLVAVAGSLTGMLALLEVGAWRPGWLLYKANRLVEGDAVSAFGANPGAAGLLLASWAAVALTALLPWRRRAVALALLASLILLVTLLFVGAAATDLAGGAPPSARVSLEGGVWLTLLACYVTLLAGLGEAPRRLRALLVLPALAALAWPIIGGGLSDLGLARELANVGGDFRAELARHLSLAGTSLLVAALLGVPAAIAAHQDSRKARWVLPAAGLVQTLPSLALFGLLVSPLARLGQSVTVSSAVRLTVVGLAALGLYALLRRWHTRAPELTDGARGNPVVGALRVLLLLVPVAPGALLAVILAVSLNAGLTFLLGAGSAPGWPAWNAPLASLGVRGIGSAPALIALTLYALLPIVRNVYTGLQGVPPAATEAGRGMGMSSRQLLLRVQLPLALPMLIEGLRAAAVLTIGTTTVAYLIGAGGLGVFIQRGIDQVVPDLVLLGAIPIVGLALLTDALMRALARLLTPRGVAEPTADPPREFSPVSA